MSLLAAPPRGSAAAVERTPLGRELANLDARSDEVMPILEQTYGVADANRWRQRWRIFFLACAELFGYDQGRAWMVVHYLLEPTSAGVRRPPAVACP